MGRSLATGAAQFVDFRAASGLVPTQPFSRDTRDLLERVVIDSR
jgi:hypothetical protein